MFCGRRVSSWTTVFSALPEFSIAGTLKEGYTVVEDFLKALRPFPVEDDAPAEATEAPEPAPRQYNLRPRTTPVNYAE